MPVKCNPPIEVFTDLVKSSVEGPGTYYSECHCTDEGCHRLILYATGRQAEKIAAFLLTMNEKGKS